VIKDSLSISLVRESLLKKGKISISLLATEISYQSAIGNGQSAIKNLKSKIANAFILPQATRSQTLRPSGGLSPRESDLDAQE